MNDKPEKSGEFGEPWHVEKQSTSDCREFNALVGANGSEVISVGPEVYESCWYDIDKGQLNRIVACVNACRGIPTEWIEQKASKRLMVSHYCDQHLPVTNESCTEELCEEFLRIMFGKQCKVSFLNEGGSVPLGVIDPYEK